MVMHTLLTVPLFMAALASAVPHHGLPPPPRTSPSGSSELPSSSSSGLLARFGDGRHRDIQSRTDDPGVYAYHQPTPHSRSRITFATKSFFGPDLAVQPSVIYRLVALPVFNSPSHANGAGSNYQQHHNHPDHHHARHYYDEADNTIDTEGPGPGPAFGLGYFKGDSQLYAKRSFGPFGVGDLKPIGAASSSSYRRAIAHNLQGGYYRPWEHGGFEASFGDRPQGHHSHHGPTTSSSSSSATSSAGTYEPFLFPKRESHQTRYRL